MKNYFEGSMRVCSYCFNNIENLTLIIPKNYSVMFDNHHNTKDSLTNLILPKDSELFTVHRRFSTVTNYEHETWPLVAHKDCNEVCAGSRDDHYSVRKPENWNSFYNDFRVLRTSLESVEESENSL